MCMGGIIYVWYCGVRARSRALSGPLQYHQVVITAQAIISAMQPHVAAWSNSLFYSHQGRAKQHDYNLYKHRCSVCVCVSV